QALAGHDQAVAEGRDGLQESRRLGRHFLVQDDLAGVIEDAQVHCPGVQIDAAVESVRLVVGAHSWSPLAWVREPEPASWLEGYTLPENPTFGPKLHGFEPVYPWDRPRPIPSETMISIKALHPTAAASRVSRVQRLTSGRRG